MASILFQIVRTWNSQFKLKLSQKLKTFSQFFFHFWNLRQYLNIFKESMIVITNVFPKLATLKILLRPLSKKHLFKTRFDSQHVKASQILAKSS